MLSRPALPWRFADAPHPYAARGRATARTQLSGGSPRAAYRTRRCRDWPGPSVQKPRGARWAADICGVAVPGLLFALVRCPLAIPEGALLYFSTCPETSSGGE